MLYFRDINLETSAFSTASRKAEENCSPIEFLSVQLVFVTGSNKSVHVF